MDQFIVKHPDKITGMISCFDRILFKDFKHFASLCSDGINEHAQDVARKAGRRPSPGHHHQSRMTFTKHLRKTQRTTAQRV